MHVIQNPRRWKNRGPLDLRLNNHKKDVNNPKVIPAGHNVKTHCHNFMKHVKFALIEQLCEPSNISLDTLGSSPVEVT